MMAILEANSLYKRFGNVQAVDNVSFKVNRGEIFGFLGPNGAGKTTTIRIMTGLLKPDKGNVAINCSDRGRSIGICPQNIVVWENLTCFEQILYMGKMYNMPSGEVKNRSNELLDSLGLTGFRDRLAKNLSGGMRRRLNIGLALIHSPEIVFLDEPQAGLDPQSRVLVRDYIKSIKDKTTVVLTTHDMEEAEKLSDRICIIDKGRLLVTGTADEIIRINGYEELVEIDFEGDTQQDLLPFINKELFSGTSLTGKRISFTTRNPVLLLECILNAVKDHDLNVIGMQSHKKSLEDIFISLTGRRIRE